MAAAISSTALVSTIESEILKEEENLRGVDENIRRLTGRDFTEQRPERRIRLGSFHDDAPPAKRRSSLGVFARLGAPVLEASRLESRRRISDVSANRENQLKQKTSLSSFVARPVGDGKSRNEAAAELTKDRASRDRNRRMFGALLGTLQRFKSDEAKQKDKEEQRAAIERKLEEKGRAEKEELRREKMDLFNRRKEQKERIKHLTFKMIRVKEHEAWEMHQRKLERFIRTEKTPRIFWLPKIANSRTSRMVSATKEAIERELGEERLRLKEEFDEDFFEPKGPSPKEEDEGLEVEEQMETAQDLSLGEGGDLSFSNCPDLLDYEAEMVEVKYEDELVPSGKNPERVVVQVASDVNGMGNCMQRRVELVPVLRKEVTMHKEVRHDKVRQNDESEKENKLKSHVEERKRDQRTEAIQSRSKEHRRSEGSKGERERHRDKEKTKKRETSQEKLKNHKEKQRPESLKTDSNERLQPETAVDVKNNEAVTTPAEANDKIETEEVWSEDLSHISLPLEPQPDVDPISEPLETAEISLTIVKIEKEDNLPSPIKTSDNLSPKPQPDTEIENSEKTDEILPMKVEVDEEENISSDSSTTSSDSEEDSSSSSSSSKSASSETGSSEESGSSSSESSDDSELDKKKRSKDKMLAARKREEERRRRRSSSSSDSSSDDSKDIKKKRDIYKKEDSSLKIRKNISSDEGKHRSQAKYESKSEKSKLDRKMEEKKRERAERAKTNERVRDKNDKYRERHRVRSRSRERK